MKTAIVVPTIRPERMGEFVEKWSPFISSETDWIIVEDSEEATYPNHYDWAAIDAMLGDAAGIISRQDSAIRSFGFYVAWEKGYEFIVTIDDDCLPTHGYHGIDFAMLHRVSMEVPRFVSTISGVRVRGLPYGDVGGTQSVVNVGLWRGVLDFDSVSQLCNADEIENDEFSAPQCATNFGQYIPMCGMNLAFKREVLPLMYFGLQGRGRPVGRFDDIWCGVLAKRICDHLGLCWTFGQPMVHHSRASDPFSNLMRESAGIAEHERYWLHLADTPLTEQSPAGCMQEAANHIARYSPKYMPEQYFLDLADATEKWATLFSDP